MVLLPEIFPLEGFELLKLFQTNAPVLKVQQYSLLLVVECSPKNDREEEADGKWKIPWAALIRNYNVVILEFSVLDGYFSLQYLPPLSIVRKSLSLSTFFLYYESISVRQQLVQRIRQQRVLTTTLNHPWAASISTINAFFVVRIIGSRVCIRRKQCPFNCVPQITAFGSFKGKCHRTSPTTISQFIRSALLHIEVFLVRLDTQWYLSKLSHGKNRQID